MSCSPRQMGAAEKGKKITMGKVRPSSRGLWPGCKSRPLERPERTKADVSRSTYDPGPKKTTHRDTPSKKEGI